MNTTVKTVTVYEPHEFLERGERRCVMVLEEDKVFIEFRGSAEVARHEVDTAGVIYLDPHKAEHFCIPVKPAVQRHAMPSVSEDAASWLMEHFRMRLQIGTQMATGRARVVSSPSLLAPGTVKCLKDVITGVKADADFTCFACKRQRVVSITALGVRCVCGKVTP